MVKKGKLIVGLIICLLCVFIILVLTKGINLKPINSKNQEQQLKSFNIFSVDEELIYSSNNVKTCEMYLNGAIIIENEEMKVYYNNFSRLNLLNNIKVKKKELVLKDNTKIKMKKVLDVIKGEIYFFDAKNEISKITGNGDVKKVVSIKFDTDSIFDIFGECTSYHGLINDDILVFNNQLVNISEGKIIKKFKNEEVVSLYNDEIVIKEDIIKKKNKFYRYDVATGKKNILFKSQSYYCVLQNDDFYFFDDGKAGQDGDILGFYCLSKENGSKVKIFSEAIGTLTDLQIEFLMLKDDKLIFREGRYPTYDEKSLGEDGYVREDDDGFVMKYIDIKDPEAKKDYLFKKIYPNELGVYPVFKKGKFIVKTGF